MDSRPQELARALLNLQLHTLAPNMWSPIFGISGPEFVRSRVFFFLLVPGIFIGRNLQNYKFLGRQAGYILKNTKNKHRKKKKQNKQKGCFCSLDWTLHINGELFGPGLCQGVMLIFCHASQLLDRFYEHSGNPWIGYPSCRQHMVLCMSKTSTY